MSFPELLSSYNTVFIRQHGSQAQYRHEHGTLVTIPKGRNSI